MTIRQKLLSFICPEIADLATLRAAVVDANGCLKSGEGVDLFYYWRDDRPKDDLWRAMEDVLGYKSRRAFGSDDEREDV